ncbi:nuclear transport factor 2 family protein [Nonomuraea sp. M3C6]|uniref:Nuclear transport factor 2 family protein n=1 Tax=Nonomuraea marmarensis TaxID=3351344 RepID=A0ABW7AU91_9ACTN
MDGEHGNVQARLPGTYKLPRRLRRQADLAPEQVVIQGEISMNDSTNPASAIRDAGTDAGWAGRHLRSAVSDPAAEERAIIAVVDQVATAADHRDWAACRAAFTDTVALDHDSGHLADMVAADDVIDGWRHIWDGFSATFHAVTNHAVTLDGDRARCRSHVQALHIAVGVTTGDNAYTTYGFYDDHLVRTAGGWKISAREYRQIFETGNKEIFMNPTQDVRSRNVSAVHTYFRLQQEQDLDTWISLWAEDGEQAIPYAPTGFPKLVAGRSSLDEIYRGLFAGYAKLAILDLQVDALHDPNRVLARWHTHADLADGGTYDNDLIGLFEFNDDGALHRLTEYFDPTAFGGVTARRGAMEDDLR